MIKISLKGEILLRVDKESNGEFVTSWFVFLIPRSCRFVLNIARCLCNWHR
jgi:hypothetical protein